LANIETDEYEIVADTPLKLFEAHLVLKNEECARLTEYLLPLPTNLGYAHQINAAQHVGKKKSQPHPPLAFEYKVRRYDLQK
jgi:hypothetical protein